MSENRTKKRSWLMVLILCLLFFFGALGLLIFHLLPPAPPDDLPEPVITTQDTAPTTTTVALPDNPIDFAAEQEKNPHVVAWIHVPGTVINYPVMQSGNDVVENYYLDHNPQRKVDRNGSIYIQQMNRADFTHPNTVLYGHNMANGSMFAALRKYRYKEVFDEFEYVYIYTPGHILKYRIYSAFVYDDRHILNSFNFLDDEEYDAFLQQTLDPRSMTKQVRKDVTVTTEDRIITMSTCTGNSRERYLVVGVLIDDQLTK